MTGGAGATGSQVAESIGAPDPSGQPIPGVSHTGRDIGVDRPRLMFVRPVRKGLPAFITQHLTEHVRCLGTAFEVTVVADNCDFGQLCDEHLPDVVMVESGVYVRPDRRFTNRGAHPNIPRIGFLDADTYCVTRSAFMSDMDSWGIEQFFTISVASMVNSAQHSDRMMCWPNFVDTDLFTPGRQKTIDVLMSGSRASNYPWRVGVLAQLEQRFPVVSDNHGGWFDEAKTRDMPVGEAYARRLGSARIVPACGGFAGELVRKHLEIPASGSCLVTERTPAVEVAGFVDMVNCVFADADDVVDKVDHLLAHPDELARITRAGTELVRSRHSIGMRDEVRQWFDLQTTAGPDQIVIQDQAFEPLRCLPRASRATMPSVVAGFLPSHPLSNAQEALDQGETAAAAVAFREALDLHYAPEAAMGMAWSELRLGAPGNARSWAWSAIERSVFEHGAEVPDAVEWALYSRALMCEGNLRKARKMAVRFLPIEHPELLRTAYVALALGRAEPSFARTAHAQRSGSSLHSVGDVDWVTWRGALVADLSLCGQTRAAGVVERLPEPGAGIIVGPVGRARGRLDDKVFRIRRVLRRAAIRQRLHRLRSAPRLSHG